MSVIQTARASTTISPTSNSTVTLIWGTPFSDNNYFVLAQNPEFQLGSSQPLPGVIVSWAYSVTPGIGITVVVNNPNSGSLSTVVEAVGIVASTVDLTNLSARLSAIDGIGLSDSSTGDIPVIEADLNGLRTTLSQLVLTLQSQLNNMQTQLNNIQGVINLLTNH